MKKLLASLFAVLVAAPLAVSAQTTRSSDTSDTKAPTWKNTRALHETKDIIGTRIKSSDGKDLGEVDQLLIDTRTGKVSYAVIGVGGLAGVGEKKVVVPWSELKMSPTAEGKKNAIVMDQAKLDSAPRYERNASSSMERSPSASPSSTRAPYNPNKQ